MSNKRVKCCFFPQREDRLTNHNIRLSIFTAITPVPEQTDNIPSEYI